MSCMKHAVRGTLLCAATSCLLHRWYAQSVQRYKTHRPVHALQALHSDAECRGRIFVGADSAPITFEVPVFCSVIPIATGM